MAASCMRGARGERRLLGLMLGPTRSVDDARGFIVSHRSAMDPEMKNECRSSLL